MTSLLHFGKPLKSQPPVNYEHACKIMSGPRLFDEATKEPLFGVLLLKNINVRIWNKWFLTRWQQNTTGIPSGVAPLASSSLCRWKKKTHRSLCYSTTTTDKVAKQRKTRELVFVPNRKHRATFYGLDVQITTVL